MRNEPLPCLSIPQVELVRLEAETEAMLLEETPQRNRPRHLGCIWPGPNCIFVHHIPRIIRTASGRTSVRHCIPTARLYMPLSRHFIVVISPPFVFARSICSLFFTAVIKTPAGMGHCWHAPITPTTCVCNITPTSCICSCMCSIHSKSGPQPHQCDQRIHRFGEIPPATKTLVGFELNNKCYIRSLYGKKQ